MKLPEGFAKRIRCQLGDEAEAFFSALAGSPVRGLRMNPFREGYHTPFRDAVVRIDWCGEGWEIPAESLAGVTIAHEAGAFYLQEPGAMIPAEVMNAKPGERILDLCGAPGGKSTQMGTDMKGEGLLICNEPIPKRAAILSRNVERMGISNAIVTCAWPEQLAEKWPEGFDGVMVDAPCSGEGMFRRNPEAIGEWSEEKALGCVSRQREILEAAAKMVRPGGRIVYATCTFHPLENEEQVKGFLREYPDFEAESFELPGVDGKCGWFTCWPHRNRGEGQFTALLRKKGRGEAHLRSGEKAFRMDAETVKMIRELPEGLTAPNRRFGKTVVRVPEIPDLDGIRVLRLGLHIAEQRGKNWIPDHGAALGQRMPETGRFEMNGSEALKYLGGETIEGDARGWTVMTYRGLALGWGKGSDGMIRNHYPKGLRNGKLIE